jgi:hypothetical protein
VTVAAAARTSRPWAGPAAVAAAGTAALTVVALRNPAEGALIPCPLHGATGLWCPGCGMTRGLHKLLNGDLLGALGSNLFLPVALGLLAWAFLAWALPTVSRWRLPSPARLPSRTWVVLGLALVVFAVLRNLPVAPLDALAP